MAGGVRRTVEHVDAHPPLGHRRDTGRSSDDPQLHRADASRRPTCRVRCSPTRWPPSSERPRRRDAARAGVQSRAGETANEVLDLAMRVCGGAAFRKDVAVERFFRDARAAGVMAPTTDVLYDFIGKAVCGMPLF